VSEPIVYWLTAAVSLTAVWLNIRHHVACFYLWSVTNAVWVYADATHDLLPQAVVQSMYFLLSIYGIWRWSARRNGEPPPRAATESKDEHADDQSPTARQAPVL